MFPPGSQKVLMAATEAHFAWILHYYLCPQHLICSCSPRLTSLSFYLITCLDCCAGKLSSWNASYSWWSTGLHCGMSTWWATTSSLVCLFVCWLVGWVVGCSPVVWSSPPWSSKLAPVNPRDWFCFVVMSTSCLPIPTSVIILFSSFCIWSTDLGLEVARVLMQ